jgi:hypothetical protein
MTKITLTDNGGAVRVTFDAPVDPTIAGPLLIEAAIGEAVRAGMGREELAEYFRDFARRLDAMTDEKYLGQQSSVN